MPQSCESSKTTQVLHCCSALVSSSATFRVGMFCGFFCPHYRREFERHHRRELNEINTAGEAPPSAFFPWFSVSTASLPPFRLPGWWVEYINFSTSATICLLGDHVGDRHQRYGSRISEVGVVWLNCELGRFLSNCLTQI